jgi:hypothetical protein
MLSQLFRWLCGGTRDLSTDIDFISDKGSVSKQTKGIPFAVFYEGGLAPSNTRF